MALQALSDAILAIRDLGLHPLRGPCALQALSADKAILPPGRFKLSDYLPLHQSPMMLV